MTAPFQPSQSRPVFHARHGTNLMKQAVFTSENAIHGIGHKNFSVRFGNRRERCPDFFELSIHLTEHFLTLFFFPYRLCGHADMTDHALIIQSRFHLANRYPHITECGSFIPVARGLHDYKIRFQRQNLFRTERFR